MQKLRYTVQIVWHEKGMNAPMNVVNMAGANEFAWCLRTLRSMTTTELTKDGTSALVMIQIPFKKRDGASASVRIIDNRKDRVICTRCVKGGCYSDLGKVFFVNPIPLRAVLTEQIVTGYYRKQGAAAGKFSLNRWIGMLTHA